jgi:hypothetical protein
VVRVLLETVEMVEGLPALALTVDRRLDANFALCMPISPPMIVGGSVISEARLSLTQPSAS